MQLTHWLSRLVCGARSARRISRLRSELAQGRGQRVGSAVFNLPIAAGVERLENRSLLSIHALTTVEVAGYVNTVNLDLSSRDISNLAPLTGIRLVDNTSGVPGLEGGAYAESDATWLGDKDASAFDNDARIHAAGNGNSKATWTFNDLAAGFYDVQVTWPENESRSPTAIYSIFEVNGGDSTLKATASVNQKFAPSGQSIAGWSEPGTNPGYDRPWQSLGNVQLTTTSLRVELPTRPDGTLAADGVRLVRVANATSHDLVTPLPNLATLDLRSNPLDNFSQELFVGVLDAQLTTAGQPVFDAVLDPITSTTFAASSESAAERFSNGVRTLGIGAFADSAYAVASQPDGKFVVAGTANMSATGAIGGDQFAIARFLPDGRLDETFGTRGITTVAFGAADQGDDQARDLAILPDGSIIVVGYAALTEPGNNLKRDLAVLKLTPRGQVDTTFSPGGTDGDGRVMIDVGGGNNLDDEANAVAIRPDGSIVLGGLSGFNADATQGNAVIVQLTAAGTLDPTFGKFESSESSNTEQIEDIALDANGRILFTGSLFDPIRNKRRWYTGAVLSNATFDPTFHGSGKFAGAGGGLDYVAAENNESAFAIAVQSDGKILVGGYAYQAGESDEEMAVLRLNADGTRDTTATAFDIDGIKIIDLGGL